MEAPPTEDSINKITTHYSGLRALYAPSVIKEAAQLLDAFHKTAHDHGHTRDSLHLGALIPAAADATAGKYGRPSAERTHTEVVALHAALAEALRAEGLTIAASRIPFGVAVEPLPGGPRWGWDGITGLAVALYPDGGWDLMVNTPRTRVFTIHAPSTPDGAREVAAIVHSLLRGDLADPFRASSR
ncbi:hypothetical protein ACFUEN_28985 [Streptomyces griseorubiginosus]|uniref:hypothetical protein n=1 Tax=Streptomyces griseorubiginosus TaxID=67304 RepID=UPI0036450325